MLSKKKLEALWEKARATGPYDNWTTCRAFARLVEAEALRKVARTYPFAWSSKSILTESAKQAAQAAKEGR